MAEPLTDTQHAILRDAARHPHGLAALGVPTPRRGAGWTHTTVARLLARAGRPASIAAAE